MLLNVFTSNLQKLVLNTEVKYTRRAKEKETLGTRRRGDIYVEAVRGLDNFSSHDTYSKKAIEDANIMINDDGIQRPASPAEIHQMELNKNFIPKAYRDKVLSNERKIIIDTYVEGNDYYRMLAGLPSVNESSDQYFRLTRSEAKKYHIPYDEDESESNQTPIHMLSDEEIFRLKDGGYLSKLIEANPDKRYLKFLGYDRVHIAEAREALNFDILQVNVDIIPDGIYDTYLETYEECREYFMTILYNTDLGEKYAMYDNFIGLCIMLMTIQRCAAKCFKRGISRDFYDWIFIQNLYDSYNVPFLKSLPMQYHMLIIKNLNRLLQYKSTDKVLFDLCSLLGYSRMVISKYFLVKEHRLDKDEKPLFYYKLEDSRYKNCPKCGMDNDPNAKICMNHTCNQDLTNVKVRGSYRIVEDAEKMYDVYFQAVDIKEENIPLGILDKTNRVDYYETIENDPYWWEDDMVESMKYEEAYSYIESKYISLNYMYKMTEMLFELSYAYRLFIDKYEDIEKWTVKLNRVSDDAYFKLFDVIIYMVALTCKANGFSNYVITTPTMIGHIYGFNFNHEEIKAISDIISNNYGKIDPTIIAYIYTLLHTDKTTDDEEEFEVFRESLNENYSDNIEAYVNYKIPSYKSDDDKTTNTKNKQRDTLRKNITKKVESILKCTDATNANISFDILHSYNDDIVNKMYETKDIDEYNLYKKIFKITMVTEAQTSMFTYTDENGEIQTYKSYLDYLEDNASLLAASVRNIDKDEIGEMMDHVINKLEWLLAKMTDKDGNTNASLKYAFFLNDNNIPVVRAIVELVKFFKSYTVDLASLNIIYLFDSKFYNNIKLIDDIEDVEVNIIPEEELNTLYFDDSAFITKLTYFINKYKLKECKWGHGNIRLEEKVYEGDDFIIHSSIHDLYSEYNIYDSLGDQIGILKVDNKIRYKDYITNINSSMRLNSKLKFKDSCYLTYIDPTEEDWLYTDSGDEMYVDKVDEHWLKEHIEDSE